MTSGLNELNASFGQCLFGICRIWVYMIIIYFIILLEWFCLIDSFIFVWNLMFAFFVSYYQHITHGRSPLLSLGLKSIDVL